MFPASHFCFFICFPCRRVCRMITRCQQILSFLLIKFYYVLLTKSNQGILYELKKPFSTREVSHNKTIFTLQINAIAFGISKNHLHCSYAGSCRIDHYPTTFDFLSYYSVYNQLQKYLNHSNDV